MSRPFNTAMMDQLHGFLGVQKPCFKQGHATREAAEAQLRSIIKWDDRKPQQNMDRLNVYKCRNKICIAANKPWHTGHRSDPQPK